MSRKIFNSIWIVALSVFSASLIFVMGATYRYFTGIQKKQLKIETQLAARGVSLSGMDYFTHLNSSDYRITWIGADGSILYDNEADTSDMENHLEREEVIDALKNGYGESNRYSDTLAEKLFYSAQLLPDGTVLRLSGKQNTIWTLILGFLQPIILVALLALILSVVLASRLSCKIVEPINRIDLENPSLCLGKKEYEEIEPLLRRMNAQQLEIRQNQEELEKTSRIRQEFTANASHELKTPLHAISGYAELLENNMVNPEDIRPFAGKIRRDAQRMSRLVADIIDLTRLDGGAEGMQWEEADLFRIAQNAVDSVQAEAEKRNIILTLSGEKAPCYGIPQVLYSIVYNLCDNAVKYNHENGSVDLTVRNTKGAVTLTVSDSGIGILPEHQDRIFERFYRVDKSHSGEIGGTGLGLSIVKHGVLIHGASIRVESIPGTGTTFTIVFPENAAVQSSSADQNPPAARNFASEQRSPAAQNPPAARNSASEQETIQNRKRN